MQSLGSCQGQLHAAAWPSDPCVPSVTSKSNVKHHLCQSSGWNFPIGKFCFSLHWKTVSFLFHTWSCHVLLCPLYGVFNIFLPLRVRAFPWNLSDVYVQAVHEAENWRNWCEGLEKGPPWWAFAWQCEWGLRIVSSRCGSLITSPLCPMCVFSDELITLGKAFSHWFFAKW